MRTFDLSPLYRSTVGFDRLFSMLDGFESAPGYPPYNIEQIGENGIRITIAVAGFTKDDLDVALEDNQLVIRGRQNESDDKSYLHRGIASRQFQRSFVLADGLQVLDAELQHGLLSIELERPKAENSVRTIPIRSGGVHVNADTKRT